MGQHRQDPHYRDRSDLRAAPPPDPRPPAEQSRRGMDTRRLVVSRVTAGTSPSSSSPAREDRPPHRREQGRHLRRQPQGDHGHLRPRQTGQRCPVHWLRAIGLQPREWSQLIQASGSASPFIGDVLEKHCGDVQAVIAFFTPNEYVTAAAPDDGGTGRLQARPNVLIEAGMALITDPTRTIIAVLGTQESPADLAGRPTSASAIPLSRHSTTSLPASWPGCCTPNHRKRLAQPHTLPGPRQHRPRPPTSDRLPAQSQAATTRRPQGTHTREAAQRAGEDTEARQVVVTVEAKPAGTSRT